MAEIRPQTSDELQFESHFTITPSDLHLVTMTSFWDKRKVMQSFSLSTLLIWLTFYVPFVVIFTGFHCK